MKHDFLPLTVIITLAGLAARVFPKSTRHSGFRRNPESLMNAGLLDSRFRGNDDSECKDAHGDFGKALLGGAGR